jgi:purine-binding chemotaxis protein CheW
VSTLHVLFKVAEADYALPAADVLHMESYQGATKVPGAAAHVAGLVQIRQRVVPVVDVRQRFGLPRIEPTIDSRIVVVQDGPRTVGLLVDSAREVLHIAADKVQIPPEVVAKQSRGFVRSVAQAGTRLVLLVDWKRIIEHENAAEESRIHGG